MTKESQLPEKLVSGVFSTIKVLCVLAFIWTLASIFLLPRTTFWVNEEQPKMILIRNLASWGLEKETTPIIPMEEAWGSMEMIHLQDREHFLDELKAVLYLYGDRQYQTVTFTGNFHIKYIHELHQFITLHEAIIRDYTDTHHILIGQDPRSRIAYWLELSRPASTILAMLMIQSGLFLGVIAITLRIELVRREHLVQGSLLSIGGIILLVVVLFFGNPPL